MENPSETQLARINEGRSAQYLLTQLDPILQKSREDIIARLKNDYRSGLFTEAKLVAGVAELCTLDDIVNTLKAKINLADQMANGLGNYGG